MGQDKPIHIRQQILTATLTVIDNSVPLATPMLLMHSPFRDNQAARTLFLISLTGLRTPIIRTLMVAIQEQER